MKIDTDLLYKILHVETCSNNSGLMENFVRHYCLAKNYSVETDIRGNIYATKGSSKSFPCYAAHLDTVHDVTGDGIALITLGDNITGLNPRTMQQTGIGGDDKCGIFAALHCMENLPYCKAVFFVDEEIGCVGSNECNLDFFRDCKFVVSADRRGNSDFVTDISGALSSKRFLKDVAPILKRHGFKKSMGAMADVMALRDNQIGVSVANVSAGYYNPHTSGEYINTVDLARSCSLMLDIGKLEREYPFVMDTPSYWPTWDKSSKLDAALDTFPDYEPSRHERRLEDELNGYL